MNYSLAAFQEPRGVMRVLQFIFAIVAFATTSNFSSTLTTSCTKGAAPQVTKFDYPFRIEHSVCTHEDGKPFVISADVSSDAQFFVATGVLSMMYCIFIIFIYVAIDELYRTKTEFPLADFMLTTILAIFWLSGSAAWANGTSALKSITDVNMLHQNCSLCSFHTSSFSRLNSSLIIGFLNFFLWASDLWFIYKETIWFTGGSAMQPAGAPATSQMPTV